MASVLLLRGIALEAHAGAYDASAYAADVGALVERLRGLTAVQLRP